MTKTTRAWPFALTLALPSLGLAQAEPAPAAAPAPVVVPAPAATPAPTPTAAPTPAEEKLDVAKEPAVKATIMGTHDVQSPPHPEHVIEHLEESEEAAVEEPAGASMSLFADAWAGWQTSRSGSSQIGAASGDVYSLNGPSGTQQSGFGLNWLGTDLGYDGGMWAVTSSIRMGDAVPLYNVGTLGNRSGFGVTAAYGTVRPTDGLSIDLGAFPTIFGAEVAESWNNLNYTRSELYYNMQPFWHTGLRMEYAPGEFVVRALVVNDPNTSNLGNGAVNVALQTGYDNGTFGFVVGALQSLNPKLTLNNFNRGLSPNADPDSHGTTNFVIDTFIDSIVTLNIDKFELIGNFDINLGYNEGTPQFWGGSLTMGYHFVPAFCIALRGDYLSTPDGFLYGVAADGKEDLVTGTLTFDWKPVPDVENVVLRWDNRIQMANQDVYATRSGASRQKMWFGSVLGAVVYADLL